MNTNYYYALASTSTHEEVVEIEVEGSIITMKEYIKKVEGRKVIEKEIVIEFGSRESTMKAFTNIVRKRMCVHEVTRKYTLT